MKQLTKLCLLAMLAIFASCENESTEDSQTVEQREVLDQDKILMSDGKEDPELVFNAGSEELNQNTLMNVGANTSYGATVTQVYNVIDADRAPFGTRQPQANFWWSENAAGDDYFDASTYFGAAEGQNLVYTEYSNGTANLTGTTMSGTCVVNVNVWFKNKKTWAEWSAIGGEHKKEGTAGNASNSADMDFYVIDHTRSTVTAAGGDCVQEGTFGLTQRPDPNDPNTPNYGAHVGPGGANYDSNLGALGMSSWGWLIDPVSCDPLWLIDFNFILEPVVEECEDCIGKVTDLTLNWDWYCGYNIKVYQNYENTCYATKIFDGYVGANQDFTLEGANANGTFGSKIYIYLNGCYYTSIDTDCNNLNIGPGYVKGVLEVVEGRSSRGGVLCEYVPGDNWCYRHWSCYYDWRTQSECYYGYY